MRVSTCLACLASLALSQPTSWESHEFGIISTRFTSGRARATLVIELLVYVTYVYYGDTRLDGYKSDGLWFVPFSTSNSSQNTNPNTQHLTPEILSNYDIIFKSLLTVLRNHAWW